MDLQSLADIPLIDLGPGDRTDLLTAAKPRADALLVIARRRYSPLALRCGDAISRAWLERNATPYRREIHALAARAGAAGAYMLNFSFEWGCTGALADDPAGGTQMFRVLDWRLPGLGRHVVVARFDSAAGPYYDVTWPGAVGVLTAMAPGRFSAAIHQAPMRRHGFGKIGDWAKNRGLVWRSRALAPAQLLRQVFETAQDFTQARRTLAETPLALPAIFLLAGAKPREACVIERLEDNTVIHDGPGVAGNHWRQVDAFAGTWSARGHLNADRVACADSLAGCRPAPRLGDDFAWVVPPILHRDTRLAVRANAGTGALAVLGYESMAPVTAEFCLREKDLAAA